MTEELNNDCLLKGLAVGDEQAYNRIFNDYYPRLYLSAFSIVKDSEEAKDCVMKTMASFFANPRSFDHINQVTCYLYVSIRNNCISSLRRRKSTVSLNDDYDVSEEEEVINDQLDGELTEALFKTVGQLPPRSQEVIVMYYLHDLKYREIAEKLKISERTVEGMLRYAKDRLRKTNLTKDHDR